MALNKFMHPRNRYKFSRPDFEELGQKYPQFKKHLVNNAKGKPVMDFQNPEALKALTICMLKEDYGLTVELPPDRLVPTLPLRLNYIHWMEDIAKDWDKQNLQVIDIGTGACCVYPILATSANPWQFLATETDDVNFSYAVRNLEQNKLTEKIKVVKVKQDTILEGVIGDTSDVYDFCMCNPPFFADHLEAQGLVSRSPSRPDPKTMSTASPQESVVQGGEVAFVRQMIEESNFLQGRIRVYSTMLGKKASLAPLKEILRRYKIDNFSSTEFCQGKTMRWGLAWTFDKTVVFPKSQFSQGKKEGKKSVVHIIPTQMGERREPVSDLVAFFKQLFSELKIHYKEGKHTKFFTLLTITAAENTWIHSRRKRRQMMREAASAATTSETSSQSAETSSTAAASLSSEKSGSVLNTVTDGQTAAHTEGGSSSLADGGSAETETVGTVQSAVTDTQTDPADPESDKSSEEPPAKRAKLDPQCTPSGEVEGQNGTHTAEQCTEVADNPSVGGDTDPSMAEVHPADNEDRGKDRPPAQFVLKCHMSVRVQDSNLAVELTWLGGEDIQLMHQLMQVFKNRLAQRKST